jgi:hypothetical protein
MLCILAQAMEAQVMVARFMDFSLYEIVRN